MAPFVSALSRNHLFLSLFPPEPAAFFSDMATCARTAWKVLAGCQRQLLGAGAPVSHTAPRSLPVRTFAALKVQRKGRKEEEAKKEAKKEVKKERKVVDDADRHKPFGKTAWAPVDDVYVMRHYPRTVYGAAETINMLKRFQELDFTPRDQPLYIDLRLDMTLEKKKKLNAFVSTVHLPHPIRKQLNRVLVFTEDADQAQAAREKGAAIAGGVELIQPILDGDISADFYVAVPDILPKLVPLKDKLRKKFPKSKRGSVSSNIAQMLKLFQGGHQYFVESECFIRTQIATLDMPTEHIFANLQTVLTDVCSHRPADLGPFIERAIMNSQTSEAVWFRSEDVAEKPAEQQPEQ
ncbi:large ribosomal subunit protein uL1m isoform X2 [Parambassis ranga]|uniref:Large ribosomal subunit protein uL1m n=1 Tax=Parambassis ranga TaxID=210632 RepID=A0A6P7J327_9TELE|nr:39S ribosomal protein L1, mitochondrial isoform X2 [Parambassis ranga]